jgi:acetate kinase
VADTILVLNAGSSSLKFSVVLDEEQPQPLLSGQIEELLTHPRFEARDVSGNLVEAKEWEAGTNLGHLGAIEFFFGWARGGALAGHRIVAAGHRVVHGGTKFTQPVLMDADTSGAGEAGPPGSFAATPQSGSPPGAVAQHTPQLPQVACFDTSLRRLNSPITVSLIKRITGFPGTSFG